MPTRTLRLSDEDDAIMRLVAGAGGQSVHAVILDAIHELIQRRAARKDGVAIAAEIKRTGWTHGEKS